jgi:hypothetical protein
MGLRGQNEAEPTIRMLLPSALTEPFIAMTVFGYLLTSAVRPRLVRRRESPAEPREP